MVQVTFSAKKPTIHYGYVWQYAHKNARSGQIWIQSAMDRDRFRKRITKTEKLLAPILKTSSKFTK